MKARAVLVLALGSMAAFAADEAGGKGGKHLQHAANVFNEIMGVPDRGIPQDLLNRAQCIGIVPNLKRVGFVLGGKYGKGVLSCRTDRGAWSAPAIMRVEGGNIGAQIGAGETDMVFIVMNKSGEDRLMQDKFTVGGDVAAMAGPVGREGAAQTDAMMHAEILSYSRSRGLFAGATLGGSTLRPDKEENDALYGSGATMQQILTGGQHWPASGQALHRELNRYAPEKRGGGV